MIRICTALIMLMMAGMLSQSASLRAEIDPPLDRFEADIQRFEEQDGNSEKEREAAELPLPGPETVFVGSSTIARWQSLEAEFRPFGAINRGFGGSTLPEITHYARRIVCKYRPKQIVVYAGTNDIGQFNHSGRRVFEDFKTLVEVVRKDLPRAQIFFVSMSVAPSRVHKSHEFDEGNRLIREYAQTQHEVYFIDVTGVMHDERGNLKQEYFDPEDRLHMSRAGYDAWLPIIRNELARRGVRSR
jgi:lysophospholipase L1-like esterase